MFSENDKKRIVFVYKQADSDRKRNSAVIALAIEFDVLPKFVRLVLYKHKQH